MTLNFKWYNLKGDTQIQILRTSIDSCVVESLRFLNIQLEIESKRLISCFLNKL